MAVADLKRLGSELVRSGLDYYRDTIDLPPLTGQTLDLDDAEIARKWLRNPEDWNVEEPARRFEDAFAKWNGSHSAAAFSAGRKALSACIHALELKPGDEVILPGYTCIVVQNAFDFAGIKTIHCDIETETFGPQLESVAAQITPRTKAILVHHLYGLVCRDFEAILAFAQERGIRIIEDCAHATGALYNGLRVGNFGDVGFYSTEWSKVMCTVTGGVAVTNNPRLGERLREFAAQCVAPQPAATAQILQTTIRAFWQTKGAAQWWGLPWARYKYGTHDTVSTCDLELEGRQPSDYLTRMSAPQAELGLNQLRKIDAYNAVRRQTAETWAAWCDENGYKRPLIVPKSQPVFLRYPVLVEPARKKDTNWAKRQLKINLGVWFKTHLHPSPKPLPNCPNADTAVARCVNFPSLPPRG